MNPQHMTASPSATAGDQRMLTGSEAVALISHRSDLPPVQTWFAQVSADACWSLRLPLAGLAAPLIDLVLSDVSTGSLYRLRLSGRYLAANSSAFAISLDGTAIVLQLSAAEIDRFQDRHPGGSGRSFEPFLRTTLRLCQTAEGNWQAPYPEQFRLPPAERGD